MKNFFSLVSLEPIFPVKRILAVLLSLVLVLVLAQAGPAIAYSDPIKWTTLGETRYGAYIDPEGWVNFSVYAPYARQVNLLIFREANDTVPDLILPMNRTQTAWEIRLRGAELGTGLHYMYQANGINDVSPSDLFGSEFNENFYLNDPYAYDTQNVNYSSFFQSTPYIDIAEPIYAGGGKSKLYDHSQDIFPGHVYIKPEDLILYELHVQDYTARIHDLDPTLQGTYLGLAQSGLTTPGGLAAGLDHLVELGVNAVELMPVMEYDEETGNGADRHNHWGYMTTNFFAPEARYAAIAGQKVTELKQLVKALHDRGIAVFMDVVFNHTGEQGPWLSDGRLAIKYYNFNGLSGPAVYRSTTDKRYYYNDTGTGNDVNFTGPDKEFTKQMVRDSLAMWYQVYGIDGFRFDLARILADESVDAADWIDNDPRFAPAHLHAEPWDLGGIWWNYMDDNIEPFFWNYENNRWAKWLGRYRDKMRLFSQSELQNTWSFKQLIEGYGSVGAGHEAPASSKPWRSINFIAVHDGYTLRDCTYFNDPAGEHSCWDSNGDENLRRERSKQLLGILLTSQGTPLILQGDEFGRTKAMAFSQAEAHNTYNYESMSGNDRINHVNWIDWRLKDGDNRESPTGPTYGKELFEWTKHLIALRKQWSHFRRADFAEYTLVPDDDLEKFERQLSDDLVEIEDKIAEISADLAVIEVIEQKNSGKKGSKRLLQQAENDLKELLRKQEAFVVNHPLGQGDLNDGKYTYIWEGPEENEPTELAVVWWGKIDEPDLMVIYNEAPEAFTVTDLGNWSQGDWKVLAKSWETSDTDFCRLDAWETDCPIAGDELTIRGRSMAVLISDND